MDELAKRFADFASKYGPNVVDAALAAARTEGYSIAAGAIFRLVLALLLVVIILSIIFVSVAKDKEMSDEVFIAGFTFNIIGSIIVIILFISATWTLIDPWTWAAINHPEAYLAKRAMSL